MTDTKHTPGPWVWEHWQMGLTAQNGTRVLAYYDYEGMSLYGKTEDEQNANAHLIAAAPDLLEALGEAVSAIEWWQREHGCCHGATDDELNAARAAIAKAKGQTE